MILNAPNILPLVTLALRNEVLSSKALSEIRQAFFPSGGATPHPSAIGRTSALEPPGGWCHAPLQHGNPTARLCSRYSISQCPCPLFVGLVFIASPPAPGGRPDNTTMSYYFAVIGTQDNPLFEYEFGTSKQGGDGQPRFSDESRHLNQFVLHSSLDIVEEVQWTNGQM